MKKISSIEPDYAKKTIVRHVHGMTMDAAWFEIATALKRQDDRGQVLYITHKKFGAKSAESFLMGKGLTLKKTGKDHSGHRAFEISRGQANLELTADALPTIQFTYDDKQYSVVTQRSLFSRRGLDVGSKALLDNFLADQKDAQSSGIIADLGAGWGALSLVVAAEVPGAIVVAVEHNRGSFSDLQQNARGVQNIIPIFADVTAPSKTLKTYAKRCSSVISNPPFHASDADKALFMQHAAMLLNPDGVLYMVCEKHFTARFAAIAEQYFKTVRTNHYGSMYVLVCSRKKRRAAN